MAIGVTANRCRFPQVTGQTVQQHRGSLCFFTEASKNRWRVLIPDGEENQWQTKCMIWVRTNIDLPPNPTVAARSTENANFDHIGQFTIEYDEFVKGTICDPETLNAVRRGGEGIEALNPEGIYGLNKPRLQEICSMLKIRFIQRDTVDVLRAFIKENREWELTDEEQQLLTERRRKKSKGMTDYETDLIPADHAPKRKRATRSSEREQAVFEDEEDDDL